MLTVRVLSLSSTPELSDFVFSALNDALAYGVEKDSPAASFIALAFRDALAFPIALEFSDECNRPPELHSCRKISPFQVQ